MTPRLLTLAATLLIGAAISAHAEGQTPVPDATNPGGSIPQQERNRNNTIAPGGQVVELAPEQRTRIKEYVTREHVPRATVKERYRIGATVRALSDSPYRVALLASSGWSHAFLTAKNHFLWPDTPSDRRMYEAFRPVAVLCMISTER